MNQEKKKELMPAIKAVLKKYNMKGSVSVRHYSELVVTLKSGAFDLIGDANQANQQMAERRGETFYPINGYFQVNPYYIVEHSVDSMIASFYEELLAAMKGEDWYNRSDSMTDYFDIAWYISINVGSAFDKPYLYRAA